MDQPINVLRSTVKMSENGQSGSVLLETTHHGSVAVYATRAVLESLAQRLVAELSRPIPQVPRQ